MEEIAIDSHQGCKQSQTQYKADPNIRKQHVDKLQCFPKELNVHKSKLADLLGMLQLFSR